MANHAFDTHARSSMIGQAAMNDLDEVERVVTTHDNSPPRLKSHERRSIGAVLLL